MAVTLKLIEDHKATMVFYHESNNCKTLVDDIMARIAKVLGPLNSATFLYNCINRGYYSLARTRMSWLFFSQLECMLSATSWVCASVFIFQ